MADRNRPTGYGEQSSRGAGDKVKDAAHEAREKVSAVASRAKHQGENLIEEGTEKAQEKMHEVGDTARSRADQERTRVAGGIHTVADALRRSGRELPEDRRIYGQFVSGVADRVDNVSRYLETHNVDDLTREVRRFARDHTPIFLGSAFALGMMGARFLKSSDDTRDYDDRMGSWPREYDTDVRQFGTGTPQQRGERVEPWSGDEYA